MMPVSRRTHTRLPAGVVGVNVDGQLGESASDLILAEQHLTDRRLKRNHGLMMSDGVCVTAGL
jgi:hypothetical protein